MAMPRAATRSSSNPNSIIGSETYASTGTSGAEQPGKYHAIIEAALMLYNSDKFSIAKLDTYLNTHCAYEVVFSDPLVITRGMKDYRTQFAYMHQFFDQVTPLMVGIVEDHENHRIILQMQVKYVLKPIWFINLGIPIIVKQLTVLHLGSTDQSSHVTTKPKMDKRTGRLNLGFGGQTQEDEGNAGIAGTDFVTSALTNTSGSVGLEGKIILHEDIWNPLEVLPVINRIYGISKYFAGMFSSMFMRTFLLRHTTKI